MKKFSLLVALIAVLAYAGWRMGYVKPPFMKTAEQQEGAAQGGAGGGRGGFDGPVVITAFDLDECRRWFEAAGVTKFKWPERVVAVPELPVLASSGKADRAELRRRAARPATDT